MRPSRLQTVVRASAGHYRASRTRPPVPPGGFELQEGGEAAGAAGEVGGRAFLHDRPCSRTTTRSASSAVDGDAPPSGRRTLRGRTDGRSAARNAASLTASTAAVASSSKSTAGRCTSARASARSCCCPAESCCPRPPLSPLSRVWYPCGSAWMKASAPAILRGFEHVGLRHRRVPEREVLEDRSREQLHDLRHHAQERAAFGLVQRRRIAARDAHGSGPRRVEPGEEVERAGLAGAGSSDQRDVLARVDRERRCDAAPAGPRRSRRSTSTR